MTLPPPEREAVEEREQNDGTAARRRKADLDMARWWDAVQRQKRTGRYVPPPNDDPWSPDAQS